MESVRSIEHDPQNTTIFIGGLDPQTTEPELRAIFMPYGTITHVKLLPEKQCGFVQYSFRSQAEAAMQAQYGATIGRQRVRLSWGRSPQARRPGVNPVDVHAALAAALPGSATASAMFYPQSMGIMYSPYYQQQIAIAQQQQQQMALSQQQIVQTQGYTTDFGNDLNVYSENEQFVAINTRQFTAPWWRAARNQIK
eukprot:TRINITY_DN7722_c0_g1_i1.p1 TRINITY_DN7722_c0_g1~~TRINITY_DN7722_c0_g1_i1.p1  ORF type:complete len:208 (-),score=44.93 TRINITY_DN7722_c0_g1_i1:36-623(-)